ncbi:MAG TPA: endonuclease/exonuclease/phosphatase family protein, partial [Thermoanaerobaculia bacterium]|nr:endonuclease/exonuclease/phosphatase family protein [Thermoanaerobaculia bacterium]
MRLKVITYNIHRAIGVDRRFRPQRVVDILRHYEADVVLLQEVDEGAPRSRELNLAKELAEAAGYPHFALGHNVSLKKGRYGNATLSRFPILREKNIDLSVAESWIRRGCQHTTLELNGTGRRMEV